MTEIRFELCFSEIQMLKDFMEKGCGIDDIALQWTDELYGLLSTLGHIVSGPDFDEITWKQMYEANKEEKLVNINEITICQFMEEKNGTDGILRCPDCGMIHNKKCQTTED